MRLGLGLMDHPVKTTTQFPADFTFFSGSHWMRSEDCPGPICLYSPHLLLDSALWCPSSFYACLPCLFWVFFDISWIF